MIIQSSKNVGGQSNENYEKFLDLWKDVDLGIPEVEDVRRRLTGLKKILLNRS